MRDFVLTGEDLLRFRTHLIGEEKSAATIEKYLRDAERFRNFVQNRCIDKELTVLYKKFLVAKGYAIRSVNSMLASLNSLLEFLGRPELRVKNLRMQRQIYCAKEAELTKEEYMRLLRAAEKRPQLHLIMQTICGTGIRVSELQYFTVEAVQRGEVIVQCKNKNRVVLVPGKLRKLLLEYAKRHGIRTGAIFRDGKGRAINRSIIWARMKRLCSAAAVNAGKVYPHNLRKLFARTFYSMEKDIAKLADILGHSSIETTRIYIMTTSMEHRRKIERMGLIL